MSTTPAEGKPTHTFDARENRPMTAFKVGEMVYCGRLGLCRVLKVKTDTSRGDLVVRDVRGLEWDCNSEFVTRERPKPATTARRQRADHTLPITSRTCELNLMN
jgi:hypothetical protein